MGRPSRALPLLLLAVLPGSGAALACGAPAAALERRHVNETGLANVTVFVGQAEVTRRLQVRRHCSGPFSLVVEGLPRSLEAGSVRVDGGDVLVLEVSRESAVRPAADAERARALRKTLATLGRRLAALDDDVKRLTSSSRLLEGYVTQRLAVGGEGHPVGLESAVETIKFYNSHMQTQHAALGEAATERARILGEKKELQEVLQGLEAATALAVTVEAQLGDRSDVRHALEQPREVTFMLRYVVHDASWQASYDLHVRTAEQTVELTYFGTVQQSTGEDWQDVALTLSSSDPSQNLSPPMVRQRFITFQENRDEGYEYFGRERGGGERSGASAALLLELPRSATIPSDGQKHRKTVTRFEMSADFAHYATPSASPHAYVRATLTNSGPYPLLPSGTVRVFKDGSYVASSVLSTIVGVHGRFTSFLGVDPLVKLTVEPESRRHESSLLRGDVTTFSKRIQLSNRRSAPLKILLKESVVQSQSDKIQVELLSPTARDLVESEADVDVLSLSPGLSRAHLDNVTGALTWGACVAPSADASLLLSFSATTSRGRYISVVAGRKLAQEQEFDGSMEL